LGKMFVCMSRDTQNGPSFRLKWLVVVSILAVAGLAFMVKEFSAVPATSLPSAQTQLTSTKAEVAETPQVTVSLLPKVEPSFTATATSQPTRTSLPTPTSIPTKTDTPTPTVTPSPTLDLASCNVLGCGPEVGAVPAAAYDSNLLLALETPKRRRCLTCPKNEHLSEVELDRLIKADAATLARLREIALSQQAYPLAPGIVYIVSDYVHHIVVDLHEQGYRFRNIIPHIPDREIQEKIRITPSYCLTPQSLVVTTGDYHGLVGSNKTEAGRELFFHLGRAALFQRDGRYDIDVITYHSGFARTAVSWGGGPLFVFNGRYDFNPKQEWFEPKALEHYRTTRWTKITAAISQNRKYLFLSSSYGLTLEEHAENIIRLAKRWGIKVDRAMRFDGSESAYMAIRLGDYMVPVLNLREPLIVNCLAIEQ
jgi:hypothetical protein